jgi:hypothetical protein
MIMGPSMCHLRRRFWRQGGRLYAVLLLLVRIMGATLEFGPVVGVLWLLVLLAPLPLPLQLHALDEFSAGASHMKQSENRRNSRSA